MELASHLSLTKYEQVKELKDYLKNFIDSNESVKKTAIVLTRLWLNSYPTLSEFKKTAIVIHQNGNESDRIAIHWGMCLAVFSSLQRYFLSDWEVM